MIFNKSFFILLGHIDLALWFCCLIIWVSLHVFCVGCFSKCPIISLKLFASLVFSHGTILLMSNVVLCILIIHHFNISWFQFFVLRLVSPCRGVSSIDSRLWVGWNSISQAVFRSNEQVLEFIEWIGITQWQICIAYQHRLRILFASSCCWNSFGGN